MSERCHPVHSKILLDSLFSYEAKYVFGFPIKADIKTFKPSSHNFVSTSHTLQRDKSGSSAKKWHIPTKLRNSIDIFFLSTFTNRTQLNYIDWHSSSAFTLRRTPDPSFPYLLTLVRHKSCKSDPFSLCISPLLCCLLPYNARPSLCSLCCTSPHSLHMLLAWRFPKHLLSRSLIQCRLPNHWRCHVYTYPWPEKHHFKKIQLLRSQNYPFARLIIPPDSPFDARSAMQRQCFGE